MEEERLQNGERGTGKWERGKGNGEHKRVDVRMDGRRIRGRHRSKTCGVDVVGLGGVGNERKKIYREEEKNRGDAGVKGSLTGEKYQANHNPAGLMPDLISKDVGTADHSPRTVT